jgi:putative oxidoreductase
MHASIAERIAYGTPLDPVREDTRVHSVPRSGTALAGRILLSGIFLTSGFAKLADPASAIGYMSSVGVPNPDVLVYVAGIAELVGGLALVLGILARLASLGLVLLVVAIQYYFHAFWNLEGMEAKMQMVQFFKNLAIIGGLLMVFAHGPGRYSIDARLRRPLDP